MVTMCRGRGWKIAVYAAEHGVPHFHIERPGYRCSVGIESLDVIIGATDAYSAFRPRMGKRKPAASFGQMAGVESMKAGDKLRTISAVKAKAPATLIVHWSDGTRAKIDVSAALRGRGFRALRVPEAFERVRVGEWGHRVEWDVGPELSAETLWLETLSATGHGDAREFLEWRLRHGLSLNDTANALGISRRMVAYYSNGEKPVPRPILLACKGWEVSHAA